MEENNQYNIGAQNDQETLSPSRAKIFPIIVSVMIAILVVLTAMLAVKEFREGKPPQPVANKNPVLRNPQLKQPGETKPASRKTRPEAGIAPRRRPRPQKLADKPDKPTPESEKPFAQRAKNPRNPEYWYNRKLPRRLRNPKIIVEKSKLRLSVYDQGKLVKVYDASIGSNPADKVREGDLATPEGTFYICIRKGRKQTPYTRSLGLSYPNIEDAKRGLRDGLINRRQYNRIVRAINRKRQPPWNTNLGGAIMIHGKRASGRNTGAKRNPNPRQTRGCVSLEDKDILELYPKLRTGTKVIIKP